MRGRHDARGRRDRQRRQHGAPPRRRRRGGDRACRRPRRAARVRRASTDRPRRRGRDDGGGHAGPLRHPRRDDGARLPLARARRLRDGRRRLPGRGGGRDDGRRGPEPRRHRARARHLLRPRRGGRARILGGDRDRVSARPPAAAAPVLVAPDSYKGTFSAADVAAALGRGLLAGGLDAKELPVADGGDGTLDVLVGALGGELRSATVSDPLGRSVNAVWGLLPNARTAVVEMARASGLALLAAAEREAWAASSRGTGELVIAAAEAGA